MVALSNNQCYLSFIYLWGKGEMEVGRERGRREEEIFLKPKSFPFICLEQFQNMLHLH